MTLYAQIVFDHPLREAFTYRIPDEWEVPPPVGARVLAPFGGRDRQLGFVTGHTESPDFDLARIRDLTSSIDTEPVFHNRMLELLTWISGYYCCSLGEVLFAAFPFGMRTRTQLERVLIKGPKWDEILNKEKLSPKRRKVLECFSGERQVFPSTELRSLSGASQTVLKSLVESGALEYTTRRPPTRISEAEALYRSERPLLNAEQMAAVSKVVEALQTRSYHQFLLHGITGSGKTEVFLHAIEKTLELGKTVLVLVPEIALTPQTAARYRGRFPGQVEVLHSGLTQSRRFDAWQRVRNGEIPIVVGTRSAVFAPLQNPGLIVVDEEHDPSYKQADPAPRYHARDVASYRGHLENAVVLLGSATPSLESYENVQRGKSLLLLLPNRATAHQLPKIELVDMRHRPPTERVLSREVRNAIQETLDLRLQTILFLNRRGHSTQLACRECGKALECPNCSVTLVWHSRDRSLRCHHCGYFQVEPETCPGCGSVWIRARGYGTEQVLEIVADSFPQARSERIDLDATQEQGAHDRILSRLRKGEIDILVGTQMVSKGLDMPGVRLVVVVQAETALNVADFRSAERSFALLTQVAGRAGRGEHPGLVLIQSYAPNHYSIFSALRHDYTGFRRIENRFRRQLGLPPHTRLVNIRVESEEEGKAEAVCKELGILIEEIIGPLKSKGCRMIGPAPCPLERLQGRWRWQVLIAARDGRDRAAVLKEPRLSAYLLKGQNKVKINVDVDPMNVL